MSAAVENSGRSRSYIQSCTSLLGHLFSPETSLHHALVKIIMDPILNFQTSFLAPFSNYGIIYTLSRLPDIIGSDEMIK